jgi:phage-related minor tail protein
MPEIARLSVEVTPQGILLTTSELEKLGRVSETTEKKTKSLMDKFRDMQAVMQGPVAAARAVISGFQSVARVAGDLVSTYKVQEQAVSNLNAVLAATGGTVGLTSEELQKMAASFQSVTTFGDEAIIGMNAVLLGFRSITGDQFKRTTEAVLDMSQVMGTDLVSSANMLGKALDSPTQGMAALSRVGFVWTDQQREMVAAMEASGDIMGAQNVILGEVEKAFGGAARAAGDTATGQFDKLANSVGDLKEALGQLIAESAGLESLIKMIGNLSEGINRTREFSRALSEPIESVADADRAIAAISNQIKATEDSLRSSPFAYARTDQYIANSTAALRAFLADIEATKASLIELQRAAGQTARARDGERTPLAESGGGVDMNLIAADHIKKVTEAMNERLRVARLEAQIKGEEFTAQDRLNILYAAYVDLVDPAAYVSAKNTAAVALENQIIATRELVRTETDAAAASEASAEAAARAAAEAEAAAKAQAAIFANLADGIGKLGKDASLEVFEAIGAALAAGENGAQTFEQAMADVGLTILQQLPLLLLNAGLQLVGFNPAAGLALIAASGLVAIGAGAVSYAQSQQGSVTANALGGAYSSPSLSAYSGGVYNSPQMFAFAKGAGVFGEAGPEAIMPLERDSSGRLGVSASGASVSVIINNLAQGTTVEREERTGSDGSRQVVATIKSVVKSMGPSGEFDGIMGRYGVSPQGIRR